MSSVPSDLRYTKSHEWVSLEDSVATVGITDHAQEELGDVVYVDLPNVGRIVKVGDTFGSIESVKAVSDLYAPVAGEVVEVNEFLAAQSELVNSDPYGKGFLVKIKTSHGLEGAELLDSAEYESTIK